MVSGRLTVAEGGAIVDIGWRWGGHSVRVGVVIVVVFVKVREEGRKESIVAR